MPFLFLKERHRGFKTPFFHARCATSTMPLLGFVRSLDSRSKQPVQPFPVVFERKKAKRKKKNVDEISGMSPTPGAATRVKLV
ncbi:hypothetical protein I7I53_00837 [Histoplasma capsulatum var. duboisii H88]|uniref:Uncharacterized protein n=1 Tax=Ajellomyces capsulatus (strain H88) TaxID=544711 RepID=A0A8A1LM69_AJEC8|nr:hypothetical protein I7I53_00837 [Histoplasma capsulatum var. duboisii H88]